MPIVNMLEVKTNLPKLVEAVESGAEKEIIIAHNGKRAARTVALAGKAPRRLGLLEDKTRTLPYSSLSPTMGKSSGSSTTSRCFRRKTTFCLIRMSPLPMTLITTIR